MSFLVSASRLQVSLLGSAILFKKPTKINKQIGYSLFSLGLVRQLISWNYGYVGKPSPSERLKTQVSLL